MRRGTKIRLKDCNKKDIRVGDILMDDMFEFEVCFGWYDFKSQYGLFLRAAYSNKEYAIDKSVSKMDIFCSQTVQSKSPNKTETQGGLSGGSLDSDKEDKPSTTHAVQKTYHSKIQNENNIHSKKQNDTQNLNNTNGGDTNG